MNLYKYMDIYIHGYIHTNMDIYIHGYMHTWIYAFEAVRKADDKSIRKTIRRATPQSRDGRGDIARLCHGAPTPTVRFQSNQSTNQSTN